ncbi:Hypothetical predicted protein [Mytilus galloprovincialis]|uniref:B box-type domain-containing protein n=1 Tax=Mytilus galloprovincialis TaxID=29158 RepID=A0A8B6HA11_MYTGA|nr:Hypothetical predicted protein [Mytilus galloprovincialis]
MPDLILCGPCGYAENEKDAGKWCLDCEEGLCGDCEKIHKSIKTTRNHRLISIEDFRQIKHIFVSLNCEDHGKRLELYCKTHDIAVCVGCVPSSHKACPDIIPLDKVAENAKCSTALADLENTLTITLQNLQEIIANRESALENLEGQKQTIKDKINDTRARMMKKLEVLEQKILQELDRKHGYCKSEEVQLLTRLKRSLRDLNCLREQTSKLKSFASELQLFIGMRQTNKSVFKEVESVKETIKSVQNCDVYLQLQPSVVTLMNEVDQLGEISVKKTTTSLPFREAKVDQAQIQLPVQETNSINNIQIRLRKRFDVEKKGLLMWLSGCTILSNGNVLIADYLGKDVIKEYSEDGKHIRDIPCSNGPFDFTVTHSDCIAVTYGDKKYVEILDINNNTVVRKFIFEEGCYGISYMENKLFIIIGGIVITDITGGVLKTLDIDCGSYLKTTKDGIYFTHNSTVNCISLTGEKI